MCNMRYLLYYVVVLQLHVHLYVLSFFIALIGSGSSFQIWTDVTLYVVHFVIMVSVFIGSIIDTLYYVSIEYLWLNPFRFLPVTVSVAFYTFIIIILTVFWLESCLTRSIKCMGK